MKKPAYTVMLLAGGDSAERDVSLSSSRGIAKALREAGHRVLVCDPARPHITPTEYDDAVFGDAKIGAEPPVIDVDIATAHAGFVKLLLGLDAFKIDVVFMGLHGGAGENGIMQAVLEYLGVPFTGSSSTACAHAMDKHRAKILAEAAGVSVPPGLHFEASALAAGTLEQQVRETVGLPAVVKPNSQGSSVGLTIIDTFSDLDAAARLAFTTDTSILVERYIEGRELTQSVLEDGPETPVLEIRPRGGLYDYFHKYQSGNTEYIVPAPIDVPVARAVTEASKLTFAALGLSVYARIDFRLDSAGRHYMLEANPLPGMTAMSLVPKACAAVGMSYTELCDWIVRKSLARFR
ncbi:MAG TPA: D-alanine--D-alanine ligase [Candidatus Krumholzibacteria bacterium]|nr:D-alanine--D-alanine ligase [Candidatus Krumholzibacteria bacterium]